MKRIEPAHLHVLQCEWIVAAGASVTKNEVRVVVVVCGGVGIDDFQENLAGRHQPMFWRVFEKLPRCNLHVFREGLYVQHAIYLSEILLPLSLPLWSFEHTQYVLQTKNCAIWEELNLQQHEAFILTCEEATDLDAW